MENRLEMIERQYATGTLIDRITAALKEAGKDVNSLTHEDTHPFDEFHIRGREGTRELADAANLSKGQSILDIGCGIGGPSVTLATEYNCHVTGIDLVEEYCQTATQLAEWLGMNGKVKFQQANATDLPFEDGTFDAVYSQHASMNIEDKQALFNEFHRVLHADGQLAIHTICSGPGGDPIFPVPWADDPSISFLSTQEKLKKVAAEAGFKEVFSNDVSAKGLVWFQEMIEKMKSRPADQKPPPGLYLLMGANTKDKVMNIARNLAEGRITVMQAVFSRNGKLS